MLGDTVQMFEVVWVLAALIGMIIWLVNLHSSLVTYRIAILLEDDNGRKVWSRFSVTFCVVVLLSELSFLAASIASMVRPGTETSTEKFVLVYGLALSAALIGVAGIMWRTVERELIGRTYDKEKK